MEMSTAQVNKQPYAWLFLGMSEEEIQFHRRFVERHGGSFTAVEQPARGYRLDFPPDTRMVPHEEAGLPLRESYQLVYPDGARVLWYRAMKLDGRELRDVLPLPVEDEQDWALFNRI